MSKALSVTKTPNPTLEVIMRNPTLSDARRIIRNANPGVSNLSVAWAKKPTATVDYRGRPFGASGIVRVSGDGYKPRLMTVERFDGGLSVR